MLVSLKTGAIELSSLAQRSDLHFPTAMMNLEAKVRQYKAVIARNQKLVNVGSSVRIQPVGEESAAVSYGLYSARVLYPYLYRLIMVFWWRQFPFCHDGTV